MNPLSAVAWIWKALRGHSVTFALLFALAVAGVSVLGWIKAGLRAAGGGWLVVLVFPTLVVAVFARKESEWIPDPQTRRRWARALIFASLLAAAGTRVLFPPPPSPKVDSPSPTRAFGPRNR